MEQKIVIIRGTKLKIDCLIDEYKEKGFIVKQISYGDSWGNWGLAILFEKGCH